MPVPVRRFGRQRLAYSRHPPLYNQLDAVLSKLQFALPPLAVQPKVKPFWLKSPPKIDFLFSAKKADITPTEALSKFNKFKAENPDSKFMYTDGSKHKNKVGFALATA